MDLNAATAAAATRGKDLRDSIKDRAGSLGNALALAVLVIGGLIVWWTWPKQTKSTTPTETSQRAPATHQPFFEDRKFYTAPVGRPSEEVSLPVGRCMRWSPKTSVDKFSVEYYWDGRWHSFVGGSPNFTTVRFTSLDDRPAEVEVLIRNIGQCP